MSSTGADVSQYNSDSRIPGHLDNSDTHSISGCSDSSDVRTRHARRYSITELCRVDISPLVSTVTSMGSRSVENRANSPRALRLRADSVIIYPIDVEMQV
jgi:hypothetical protein